MKHTIEQFQNAIVLACQKHANHFDKCDQMYILHPLTVMFKVKKYGLHHMIVAILHDIIEDADVTLEDLRNMEYDDIVIDAIDAISRKKGENYWDYIARVKSNPIARVVKLADLEHNMDPQRLQEATEDIEISNLMKKYVIAYRMLIEKDEAGEYPI